MERRYVRQPGNHGLPSRSQHLPRGRGLLSRVLQLRVLPRRAYFPQPGPRALEPDRQRAGTAASAGHHAIVRRCLRPGTALPRRPVLADHVGRLRRRHGAVHRYRAGRVLVRAGPPARGRGHRPGSGLGRRRPLLVHLCRNRAGRYRPGDRADARGAAPGMVRHTRRPVARGSAPVPHRRLLVPADRRGRDRARPLRVGRPRPSAGRAVRAVPGQPDPDSPQHQPADPEHRPRGPGPGTRRVVVDGPAGRTAAGRHPRLARAGTRDIPRPGDVGRGLAGRGRGGPGHGRSPVAGAAGRRAAGARWFRRATAASAVDLAAFPARRMLFRD